MIVGILSHTENLAHELYEQINFKLNSNFQEISSADWSQCMNIGVIVNYPKKFKLLQKLEKLYGNIFVSGNLFLDYDVRSQITQMGGKIFFITVPNETNSTFTDPAFKGIDQ